ncbi:hypothetical protein EEB19_14195 [Gordonia sp. OPL2]|nr:hypothetical protein EEB19_14195 [Gordonia sp. OPL2]
MAGIALAGAIGITGFATAPAFAQPAAPQPGASAQVTIPQGAVDWAQVSTRASAAGDAQGAASAAWILGDHPQTPTATDLAHLKSAVLAAVRYTPAADEESTGSAGSSSGSSSGSATGSSDLIGDAVDDFFDNFNWETVTVPLLSAFLQAQGIPAVVATPLAQLIWNAIEATFPSEAA